MPRSSKQDESDSESDQTDFSDIDYEFANIPTFLTTYVSAEKIRDMWNNQSGCCFITNIPLDPMESNSIYMIEVASRRVTEPISDTNSILVCKGVKAMLEASGLTCTQFRSFLKVCTNQID